MFELSPTLCFLPQKYKALCTQNSTEPPWIEQTKQNWNHNLQSLIRIMSNISTEPTKPTRPIRHNE